MCAMVVRTAPSSDIKADRHTVCKCRRLIARICNRVKHSFLQPNPVSRNPGNYLLSHVCCCLGFRVEGFGKDTVTCLLLFSCLLSPSVQAELELDSTEDAYRTLSLQLQPGMERMTLDGRLLQHRLDAFPPLLVSVVKELMTRHGISGGQVSTA